ncbi:hypothetical protein KAU11_03100 [Candidatus Babeliales bacterium]|nr:hypothetical protein [Candidatus Babeliales bacterium]
MCEHKRAYFAHSRYQYGLPEEKQAIKWIQMKFPYYKIYNPGSAKHQKELLKETNPFMPVLEYMGVFFRIIDTCNILVYTTITGTNKVGRGTFEEIKYAFITRKIPVYYITSNGKIQAANFADLTECHMKSGKKDWSKNWAKVNLLGGDNKRI